ncbi:VPLPA-CTERM sorting domain-containing protein [Roseobacter sp. A03A-229]
MKLLHTALFCALTAIALPAQAATVTLDLTRNAPAFSDSLLNNGDTVSNGPFSLTFQNLVANGSNWTWVDTDGVFFARSSISFTRVDLVFNIDTVIETYGSGDRGNGTFQITGPNGTSGVNSFASGTANTFDMGTIPVFLAGETYTLTHDTDRGYLDALGLSHPPSVTAVPLPASLPLLLAGFGAVALLRRRTSVAR